MSRRLVVAGATAVALISVGVVVGLRGREPALVVVDTALVPRTATVRGAVSDHILVISIDGLRPDAIEEFDAEVLERLTREGAAAQHASTVGLSKTLPSHMSMLTGVPPEVHGVTWNSDSTDARGTVAVATVFEVAKRAGFTTAAFFSKPKLKHLLKPGTLDYASGPNRGTHLVARETVYAASRHMRSDHPNLMFVHLVEPDRAGHRSGWMSPAYERAVRTADAAVGQLLTAADEAYGRGGYTVIVTADHGGEGHGHNGGRAADRQIPWIAWGAGVQRSTAEGPVNTMDTAATVLWLLGVKQPVTWTGRAVMPAYTTAARYAANHAHIARPHMGSRTVTTPKRRRGTVRPAVL